VSRENCANFATSRGRNARHIVAIAFAADARFLPAAAHRRSSLEVDPIEVIMAQPQAEPDFDREWAELGGAQTTQRSRPKRSPLEVAGT
jgi:hypothetical protein